jgi:hypothetical protein
MPRIAGSKKKSITGGHFKRYSKNITISLQHAMIFPRSHHNYYKSAHTALAVKACLLGGKTATLNAQ